MYTIIIATEQNPQYTIKRRLGSLPSTCILIIDEERKTAQCFLDPRYDGFTISPSTTDRAHRTQINISQRPIETAIQRININATALRMSTAHSVSLCTVIEEQYTNGPLARYPVEEEYIHRQIKTRYEQHQMVAAATTTQAIFDQLKLELEEPTATNKRIGKTELDLLKRITNEHFAYGGTKFSFDPIIASGAHSAIPHYQDYDGIIENGPLLIDFGVEHQGYCSDMTRTYRVGDTTGKHAPLRESFLSDYTDVKNAYNAAVHHLVPGTSIDTVAAHVDTYFTGVGKRDLFTHALGHGVGVEVHEHPVVQSSTIKTIEAGMCLAIEPGLYRSGKYGIRYENTVFIQQKGAICLQDLPTP